jgi:saccharopine dehydrogenase-like NADP-dependent oxidoreductase
MDPTAAGTASVTLEGGSGQGKTRVLLIGGTVVFGSRLAAGLRDQSGVEVVIAGRSATNEVVLDRLASDLAGKIAAAAPDIVIDAAGPFQGAGDDPYRLANAAIACGAHYLDLSDVPRRRASR